MKVGELKKLIANLPANAEVKATITYDCGKAEEREVQINKAKVKAENINGNNYKTVILNIDI